MRFILVIAYLVSMVGVPSFAEGFAGSYLAGRQASLDGRLETSIHYFSKVVEKDSSNILALEQLILAKQDSLFCALRGALVAWYQEYQRG